jgi:hypothetical protein
MRDPGHVRDDLACHLFGALDDEELAEATAQLAESDSPTSEAGSRPPVPGRPFGYPAGPLLLAVRRALTGGWA